MEAEITKEATMENKAIRAGRCSECGAHVVAWKRKNVKARLLRLLAMADHLKTLHGLR